MTTVRERPRERVRERLITTPEHVPIRLVPAGVGSRFLALIVDFACSTGLALGAARLFHIFLPSAIAGAATVTVSFAVTWGYHVWFEVRHQGRTPGKKATGLRVVDGRGLPIRLEQSMVRNIVRALDFAPVFYGLGALVALFDRDGRRLGDIVADTLVVREAEPLAPTAEVARARTYNSLKTARVLRLIKHRVSLEQREFLLTLCLRAESLDPALRYDLMEQVGAHYRARLGIDDPHLSGENLVRGLTALLFGESRRSEQGSKSRV